MAIMLYRIQAVIFAALSIVGACQVWGSDLQTQRDPGYPPRSMVLIQEDFLTGTAATAQIGTHGWNSAGTISNRPGETNRPGIIRVDTGGVSGTIARINGLGADNFIPDQNHSITAYYRLNTNDANTTTRIGSGNSFGSATPSNGIYFEKLDADTNWFCVARNAGVQTRTDSTIAVNTNFNSFQYVRNSSGVQYFINGAAVCGTISTNITSTALSPGVTILNSAAAAKTFDLDYFEFRMFGLSR